MAASPALGMYKICLRGAYGELHETVGTQISRAFEITCTELYIGYSYAPEYTYVDRCGRGEQGRRCLYEHHTRYDVKRTAIVSNRRSGGCAKWQSKSATADAQSALAQSVSPSACKKIHRREANRRSLFGQTMRYVSGGRWDRRRRHWV